jgi:hypothetical protein
MLITPRNFPRHATISFCTATATHCDFARFTFVYLWASPSCVRVHLVITSATYESAQAVSGKPPVVQVPTQVAFLQDAAIFFSREYVLRIPKSNTVSDSDQTVISDACVITMIYLFAKSNCDDLQVVNLGKHGILGPS